MEMKFIASFLILLAFFIITASFYNVLLFIKKITVGNSISILPEYENV